MIADLFYFCCSQPKSAGVLLMGTGGRISANSVEYMETACKINEDKVIYPFAFRTHTHALGKYSYRTRGMELQ
jgi:peptidylglycine monooxygenase